MTEVKAETTQEAPVRRHKAKAPRRTIATDLQEFREWLASLEQPAVPSVHVNGVAYPHAVLSVDFGQPLKPPKLSQEQAADLALKMRKLTKDLMGKDGNVRISSDTQHGVWWTSIN